MNDLVDAPGRNRQRLRQSVLADPERPQELFLQDLPRRDGGICPGFVWSRPWAHIAAGLKRRMPELAELDARAIFLEVVK